MTRARDALHLIAPLKYYVTQQPRYGDAHVYGARSRFLTPEVLKTMECIGADLTQAGVSADGGAAENAAPIVDVAAKLRRFWD